MQAVFSRSVRSILFALALVAAPLAARADGQLVDETTGTKFDSVQTINGVTYQCLGAGVRIYELLGFIPIKIYAATLCLEPSGVGVVNAYVKSKAGSGAQKADALANDQAFYDAIYNAPGGKLVIEHLVRNISRDDIAKAFRESLSKVLPPDKVQRLIDIIPGSPQKGEEVKIYSSGSTLTIDIAGNAKKIEDAETATKLFEVFLSKDAVSPTLKKSIATQASAM
jgi:hypothetical protein